MSTSTTLANNRFPPLASWTPMQKFCVSMAEGKTAGQGRVIVERCPLYMLSGQMCQQLVAGISFGETLHERRIKVAQKRYFTHALRFTDALLLFYLSQRRGNL